ncbi:MAG: GIY-YIG nuclease family protein [Methylococcaceae bacterium]|nr:GIY-YIG nuclease family protein [Methylococcaceae bacterium]
MPYVYILECADGSYYTGSTWNLERRLWEHRNGLGARHTAKRLPLKLVFCEECERVEDAYIREKQIQGWSRKKKEALMAGDWKSVHGLAECQNASHSRNIVGLSPRLRSGNAAQPTLPDLGDSNPSTGPILTGSAEKVGPAPNRIEVGRALTGVDMGLALAGFEVGRALSGVDVGRALSGVEGNAGRATEAFSGHASLKPDMENQENDSSAKTKTLRGC